MSKLKDVIVACQHVLDEVVGNLGETDLLCLKSVTEAFRILRNCCAEVPQNLSTKSCECF